MHFVALALPAMNHAQTEPGDISQPPAAELARMAPFLGSYEVTADYLGIELVGTLELRSAVKAWYVKSEIHSQSGPINRQLRMFITWDQAMGLSWSGAARLPGVLRARSETACDWMNPAR